MILRINGVGARARTSEPVHPPVGTRMGKKVGARGLEPPNLTDVNRAL